MKPLVIAWITQELTRQMSMQCSSVLLRLRNCIGGCANALMDMLTASNAYTSQDVSAAERSGIVALTNAYAYISSGLAHQALAVGSEFR